jgi:hypothetical protein
MKRETRLGKAKNQPGLAGSRVLILAGEFAGQEGVCLGRGHDPKKWAVSPDLSKKVLELIFEKEFGVVLDHSGGLEKN